MAFSPEETGPRNVPVPWDPSYYHVKGEDPFNIIGDMLKSEYATNGGYGVVDQALSAYYVPWAGVQNPPMASPSQAGLMPPGNGDSTFYFGGDNQLHSSAGLRGTHWFYGQGNPGTVPGAYPGDFYIDALTGNYFELS